MRSYNIYIIITVILILLGLFAYQYIFNVYEVTFSVKPEMLYADNQSTVTIAAVPVNAFGWEAPFRHSSATFEIREGNDLVEILKEDNSKGILVLKAGDKPGEVVVFIKSEHALLPSSIEILILSNLASNNN